MTTIGVEADRPLLYRHVGCQYCERVVRVMKDLDVDFRSRFVVPAHSERGHVKHVSGTRSVPVLVDPQNGVIMAESANIVDYLDTQYERSN